MSRAVLQPASTEDEVVAAPSVVASLVNFDHNKAALDELASAKLDAMVTFLADNPSERIAIFGHTDLTGAEAYNTELGKTRAEMVAGYLTSKGISADRIDAVVSLGESAPLVMTEEKSRENRRVLIQTLQARSET